MTRVVRYNGGKDSYGGNFTSPTELIVGEEYNLLYSKQYAWHTEYYLEGVHGKFNSSWFDNVTTYPPTFLAVSHTFPTIGERLNCYRAEYASRNLGSPVWLPCNTSEVQEIRDLGTNVFYVMTRNSAYIVQVS